jgi:hypothetical protein
MDETDQTPRESAYESVAAESTPDEAPTPPDVGEALAQMSEQLDNLDQRLPADEEYDDASWDSEFAYNPVVAEPEGEDPGVAQIRDLLNEEVNARMQPYVDRIEEMHRDQQLLNLADQYPQLREPEVLDAVAGEAAELAQAYGVPGMATDPRIVERLFLAHQASAAAESMPPEAPPGATLEVGAGPGEPQEDVDPQTKAWMEAAAPSTPSDVFGRQ